MLLLLLGVGIAGLSFAAAGSAAVARTPPMGWNSWNSFGCGSKMTAPNIEAIADKLVSSGLAAAGYTYLNLDDCWANASRSGDGSITGSPAQFPSMKALASYAHAKGLKFGLYTSENNQTCAGRPGSYGYELQDAATYCDWGVDFVKIDHCGTGAPGADGPSHMNESWVRLTSTCSRATHFLTQL